jgi:hypothetical protein
MKTPSSDAAVHGPVFGYPEDSEGFMVPHIKITQNNDGVKIAKTEVNGKVYEARHPHDGGRAAEALGAEISRLHRAGKLATGII